LAGGPSLHCTIPPDGAASLRFLQGLGGDGPGATLVRSAPAVVNAVGVPALRTVREGRGTRSCGGFCGLKAEPPDTTTLRFPERTGVALRLGLPHDNHQNFNFLFRLRQLRNNCGNFIEYLVPALHLTAVFRALHGFISNEGEFRPAVPEILKDSRVVRTVDRLMFYS